MKSKAFVKNAADEGQVLDAANEENKREKKELAELKSVLESKSGRALIWRYLSLCGVFQLSYTGNSETFFKEGKRDVGLKIMAEIMEASSDKYLLMQKEAMEE